MGFFRIPSVTRGGHLWAKRFVSVQVNTATEAEAMSKEGGRNIRSSGLRFWATVLERFPEGMDFNHFWGPFLAAVEPQMERMAVEVACCSTLLFRHFFSILPHLCSFNFSSCLHWFVPFVL